MLQRRDFDVLGQDGRYEATIGPRWCFDGRAFGGFSASLALAAIVRATGRPVLTSATIAFLEPGAVGAVAIEVTILRAGRSAAIAQATVHQDGRPILLATAWLVDAWLDAPMVAAAPPFGDAAVMPPQEAAPLDWLVEAWPMLDFAERRGVDYPTSFGDFRDRDTRAALWLRIREEPDTATDTATETATDTATETATETAADVAGAGWVTQLTDVLHFDAHLFDAPGMVTGFFDPASPDGGGVAMLSLDLSIAWQPGAGDVAPDAWRLLETRGSVVERGATSYASLRDETGALLAVATSQGLVRR